MLTYTTGDATSPNGDGNKVIAHVCNDAGRWGRGFVLAISRRWPSPEHEYRSWYREKDSNDFSLGAVQFVPVEDDLWIANMVAQHGLRAKAGSPPIRYEALEVCLEKVSSFAGERNASVHMPRIGCGLAGGKWEEIEPMITRTLAAKGIPVLVYDFR